MFLPSRTQKFMCVWGGGRSVCPLMQGRQSVLKSEGDVIQRLRNEFKVGGQNVRALKVRPI